jgi:nucleoside-diphosphate-sugar epimerase
MDDEGVAAARYLAVRARAAGRQPRLVRVPYPIARAVVRAVDGIARGVLGERRKLPSLFYPARFDARFKPLRFSREKLRARIGWEPPIAWDEAVRRTFQFEP